MSPPRFYCLPPLAPFSRVELPAGAARHAVRVLRLRPGDPLTLFDGRAGECAATVERIERDRVWVEVGAWSARACESPFALNLVQSLQAGEKMDYTVQKAVELGVAGIQPVSSRRSVVRLSGERMLRRVEHWQGIAAAACEQCGRNRVPAVEPVVPLADWLARPAPPAALRLLLSPSGACSLDGLPPPAGRIDLLIGAEGGLAPEEVAWAASVGFVAVRLGPRVLRTETAALAALAAMQVLWGDFRGGADDV